GSYQEMGHRDSRSVGSFFVRQQQGCMDFSGFWSGWDEVNNQLSSGTYEFKRKPLKLKTSQSTDDDVIKIKKMSRSAFGHRYFESGIQTSLEAYETARLCVIKSKAKAEKEKVLGFSLSYLLPENGLDHFLHIDQEADNPINCSLIKSSISDELREADRKG